MAKKKNFIQRYFENFGLKQINDILTLLAVITMIVGLCVCTMTEIVLIVSLALFIIVSVLSVYLNFSAMKAESNKKTASYRTAKICMIIMIVVFVLAVFGLVYGLAAGFVVPAV